MCSLTTLVFLLSCLTGSLLMAQTPQNEAADTPEVSLDQELQPADLWSSRLTQEAVDGFQTDSRRNYVVQKDVEWKPGTLTIDPDSSITIPLNSGSEGAIQLTLDTDTGTKPQTDLGVAIIPEEAPACVVEIRSRTADFPKTTSIRLLDSQIQNGDFVQRLVRDVQFDAPATIETAAVHYRYGVVSVSINGSVRMVSFVPRGAASVRGIFVGTGSQRLVLKAMSFRR